MFSFCWFLLLTWDDWKNIGQREVRIDLRKQRVVISQSFPNRKGDTDSILPFADILLLRHRRRDDGEGNSDALVIRLLLSKCVGRRPDIQGYLLHCEFVTVDLLAAETASNELTARIVGSTGIEFLDMHDSAPVRSNGEAAVKGGHC